MVVRWWYRILTDVSAKKGFRYKNMDELWVGFVLIVVLPAIIIGTLFGGGLLYQKLKYEKHYKTCKAMRVLLYIVMIFWILLSMD